MKKGLAIVLALGAVTGLYLYAVGKQIKSALEATNVDMPDESATDNDGSGGDKHTGCNCGGDEHTGCNCGGDEHTGCNCGGSTDTDETTN